MREVTAIVGARHMGNGAADAAIKMKAGDPLVLEREPKNASDANAIIVRNIFGVAVGYVQRAVAAIVAKWMDEGYIVSAKCIREAVFDGSTIEGGQYWLLYKYPRAAIYRQKPPAADAEEALYIWPREDEPISKDYEDA